MASPNSSFVWIKYMAFLVSLGELWPDFGCWRTTWLLYVHSGLHGQDGGGIGLAAVRVHATCLTWLGVNE